MSYTRPKDITKTLRPETSSPSNVKLHNQTIQQQRQSANIRTLVETGLSIGGDLLKKKMGLKHFAKDAIERSIKLQESVAAYGTPFDTFNESATSLMDSLVTQHNKISGYLDRGESKNVNLANIELAKIEGIVDQYQTGMVDIMAVSKVIENAMKIYAQKGAGAAGTLSVAGALPPQLNIIDKIRRGGELAKHIDIDHDGTNIILTDLSKEAIKMNGGVAPILNLGEFHKALQDEQKPYIKLVPNIEKELKNAYDLFTKNSNGQYNDNFATVPESFNEENKRRMSEENLDPLPKAAAQRELTEKREIALLEALKGGPLNLGGVYVKDKNGELIVGGGMFDGLIMTHGESIWEDMMPTSVTGKKEWPAMVTPPANTPEYKAYYDDFKKPMIDYLAARSVEENAIDLQRETAINRTTNKGGDPNIYNPKGDKWKEGEKEAYKENKDSGRNDYYSKGSDRLSSKFITTSSYDEDLKKLESARVGDILVLSDGTRIRRKKSQ